MKTMKTGLALLALAIGLPAAAQASYPISLPDGLQSVAQAIGEDGDVGLYCKYIGTSSACASIAVAAGGDLTFTQGTCGSESATTSFECPVSGALGGVIDVSDAACNTIGEVVDIVNASSDWRCLPYAMLRSDSSDDTLVTISATQATGPNGLGLAVDSSVALFSTVVLNPIPVNGNPSGYALMAPGPQSTSFLKNPWTNQQALLTSAYTLSTYGSGTSTWSAIAVRRSFAAAGSEDKLTLWPATANGATTVAKVFGSCDTPATGCDPAFGPSGLIGPPGYQVLFRLTNSAALSVNTIAVNGFVFNNSGTGLKGVK